MKKLAVFRLFHEANSFSPEPCDLATFKSYEWSKGLPAIERYVGSNSEEIGAAIGFAAENDWSPTYLRFASTWPCGELVPALFEQIADELVADLLADTWDAIYLALHGACTLVGGGSAELELIKRIRAILPKTPIGVSFDLHANIDPRIAELVTVAIGYKTHPHIDQREVATAVLETLDQVVAGVLHPTGAIVKLPLLLPSANMRTTDGPMRDMVAYASELKHRHRAIDISILAGFPYGDTVHAGACCMVFTNNDKALARRLADDVAAKLWSERARFFVSLPNASAGLTDVIRAGRYPVAIADNADNAGSGGIGDTPSLLRAFLQADLPEPSVFAFFHDSALVERCHQAGVGARFKAHLGGNKTLAYGDGIDQEIEVVRVIEDCRFRNSGPQSYGLEVFLGKTAVVRAGKLSIILTSVRTGASDPEFYRVHGISFPEYKLLGVKAKNHFRAAFAEVFDRIIDVDEPGPAALDFTSLPFKHVPRTFYPFVRANAASDSR
jgi:microcystin degradation protein MlrC